MTTSVFVDGSPWNVLFEQGADLNLGLLAGDFALCLTGEVEIELRAIPTPLDRVWREARDGPDGPQSDWLAAELADPQLLRPAALLALKPVVSLE
jgi:hypothetical protein